MQTMPLTLRDDLSAAYLRYIDTQYWLRNADLAGERRALLRSDGNLRSECLLEPVLPYDATVDLKATAGAAGVSPETAAIVGGALLGDFTAPGDPVKLRSHQAEAVTSHFRGGGEPGRQRRGYLRHRLRQDRELPASDAAPAGRGGQDLARAAQARPVVA